MCLLIVGPKTLPNEKVILIAEEQNPHGGGIAWRDHKAKKIRYEKGIDGAEILQILKRIEPPVVVHFRVASAGPKTKQLCHPFPVDSKASLNLSGTTSAIIAHNGTLSSWKGLLLNNITPTNKLPPGDWSDTRAMAWLAYLHGPDIFQLLDEKVVYMSMNRMKPYKIEDWVSYTQSDGEVWLSYDPFEAARRWAEHQSRFLHHSEEGETFFESSSGIKVRRKFKEPDSKELQRQIKEKLAKEDLTEEERADLEAVYDHISFEQEQELQQEDLILDEIENSSEEFTGEMEDTISVG